MKFWHDDVPKLSKVYNVGYQRRANFTIDNCIYRVKAGKTGVSGKSVDSKLFCQVKSAHCTHRDIFTNFFFPERGNQSASFTPPPPPLPPKTKVQKTWVTFWAKMFHAVMHQINSFNSSAKCF